MGSYFIFAVLMAKQYTLGKNERLKSRKLIGELFTGGNSFMLSPFRVYYLYRDSGPSSLRSGFGVSSKHFKKAVDRNRIKRLTKEAYRLQKPSLQKKIKELNHQLNIFFVYTGKELPIYKGVYDKINKILDKLYSIVSNKN